MISLLFLIFQDLHIVSFLFYIYLSTTYVPQSDYYNLREPWNLGLGNMSPTA